MDAEELSNILFFLTMYGPELPRILRSQERLKEIQRDPRGRIWIEKGEALGIFTISEGKIHVNWDAIRELKKKIIEMLEKCLENSS